MVRTDKLGTEGSLLDDLKKGMRWFSLPLKVGYKFAWLLTNDGQYPTVWPSDPDIEPPSRQLAKLFLSSFKGEKNAFSLLKDKGTLQIWLYSLGMNTCILSFYKPLSNSQNLAWPQCIFLPPSVPPPPWLTSRPFLIVPWPSGVRLLTFRIQCMPESLTSSGLFCHRNTARFC